MDPLAIGLALAAFVTGMVIGRLSARRRTRVVWTEAASNWPPDAEMEALVRAGKKIYAIKRHREIHGSDLREAKDAIDALEARLIAGRGGSPP